MSTTPRDPVRDDNLATLLKNRGFVWYLTARSVSLLGSTMAPVALAFAVLDLSNGPLALALVLAGRTGAFSVFVLYGGVISDRLPRRLVLQASHIAAAATQGMAALLFLTGHAEVWMIVALEVANGAITAFTVPALQGIIPQLVPTEARQRAMSLISFSRNGMQIAGPSLGAGIVVVAGGGWALAVDALTYLVAAVCLARIAVTGRRESADGSGSLLSDLREGWSEFTARRWLWTLVVAFTVLNALYGGAWNVLGPLVSNQNVGKQGWGLMVSVFAAGAVVAAVIMLRVRPRRTLALGILTISMLGVLFLLIGAGAPLASLLIACAAGGFGLGVFGIAWDTALTQHVPEYALSRVSSYDTLCSFVAMPLGQLGIGLLAATVSPQLILVWCGMVYTVLSLSTLLVKSIRGLTTVET